MSKAYDETKLLVKERLAACSEALNVALDAMAQIDIESPSDARKRAGEAAEALGRAYTTMSGAAFYMSKLAILHMSLGK